MEFSLIAMPSTSIKEFFSSSILRILVLIPLIPLDQTKSKLD